MMDPSISLIIAFLTAFAAALSIVVLAIFPFRSEFLRCLGRQYIREGKQSFSQGHEMCEF